MTTNSEDMYFECDKCGSEIALETPLWMFSKTDVRKVKNRRKISTDYLKEESVLILCAHCGSQISEFKSIQDAVSNRSRGVQIRWANRGVTPEQPQDSCNKCGVRIDNGETFITLNCSVGRANLDGPEQDLPSFCADEFKMVCTLCQDCDDMMGKDDLRAILFETVVKSPFDRSDAIDRELPEFEFFKDVRLLD